MNDVNISYYKNTRKLGLIFKICYIYFIFYIYVVFNLNVLLL